MNATRQQLTRPNEHLDQLIARLRLPNKTIARKMIECSQGDGGEPVNPGGGTIGRYRAGVHRPNARSAEVLAQALSELAGRTVTVDEIGYSSQDSETIESEETHSGLTIVRSGIIPLASDEIDPAFVEHLQFLLAEHVRMDALTGPRYILDALRGELTVVEELCGKARGNLREPLLKVGARFSEFAGWLFQDSGDLKAAMYWTNQAMDYAEELGDTHLTSYVLMRKSNIATDRGYAAKGLGLANAALRRWDDITPELRAVALRQLANAHAMTGEVDDCRRALDSAMVQALEIYPDRPGNLAKYCTPSYIEMEAAHSWVRLGQPGRAIETYASGLADWPASQRRDQGLCSARMAAACLGAGQFEEATRMAVQATKLFRLAPSARSLAVLQDVSKRANTIRGDAVCELKATLEQIV
ncbi:hypothetical protein OHB26_24680 [Nocardia sp. NBC_01503]|uniref:hypothetical protein n=1 Tax=Nocardia sp. NBC_01503 TaxID=2975997 RepID=UPI002E7BC77E|nr:hypothetical protein [Nocardia sp. NBC_01503]WTL30136.1 hypothetical protein OHB26_24680 [Nocardia sp. NBC_01503]